MEGKAAMLVQAGGDWGSSIDPGSRIASASPDDNAFIRIAVGYPANPTHADVVAGGVYDLLIAWVDPAVNGSLAFQYNFG